MKPALRIVPAASSATNRDRHAPYVAFFAEDLERLALATSALGLGLVVSDGAGRVVAGRGDLSRLERELRRRESNLAEPLARYLAPVSRWTLGSRELALDSPIVMGIVNLTDDSFSGDGVGSDAHTAVAHAARLQKDGADIIDVGAETARASRPRLEAKAEALAMAPVVAALVREGHLVSIDTYKAEVAVAALESGASIVNDISGLTLGTGAAAAATSVSAGYVLNYSYTVPKQRPDPPPEYEDVVAETLAWVAPRLDELEAVGLTRAQIAIDPGIAFGKSHDEDLQVLGRLGEFTTAGQPLLLAHSRKNYIGSVSGRGPGERDLETHVTTALAYSQGARLFRVHDVQGTRRALAMAAAITSADPGAFAPGAESWPWAVDATAADAIAQETVIEPPAGQRW